MHGRSIARRVAAARRAPSKGGGGRADTTAQRSIARLRASQKKFRDGLSYRAASSVYSAP
ncbi:hypothetical protein WJ99_04320 [Burkholderia ubonensis]|nr:hypothetical protein WJ99_04320 [Burkholderia ubonensis]KVU83097.1 hypothetical protein WK76_27495 [Burkholderia ubonensis]OJB36101.1 hypothetical protein BGV56_14795 [Burkholderia ubonensis]